MNTFNLKNGTVITTTLSEHQVACLGEHIYKLIHTPPNYHEDHYKHYEQAGALQVLPAPVNSQILNAHVLAPVPVVDIIPVKVEDAGEDNTKKSTRARRSPKRIRKQI